MSVTVGILVFDGVDELDFVGPLNVFSYASGWGSNGRVVTIGVRSGALQGVNGLTFSAQYHLSDAPQIDVLVVPGGRGTSALVIDDVVLDWIRTRAVSAAWICSVCTGSFVLQAAGLTAGRQITTHSAMIDQLRAEGRGVVVQGKRFVVDGNIVTSAGVCAGIDMALWVVGEIYGQHDARVVTQSLEYGSHPSQ